MIPPEIRTKGGPRHYEAIFIGYDENRVGWYVCDLNGTFHFSRNVIFNEAVSGHLSGRLSSQLSIPSSSPPSPLAPCPQRTRVHTVAGQTFADTIAAQDACYLLQKPSSSDGGAQAPTPHSLEAILDFASLNAYDSFPEPLPTWSLDSEASVTLQVFGLLSYPDPN